MKANQEKQRQARIDHFMPNGIPKKVRIYDNDGETIDRYTVVFTGNYQGRNGCDVLGMSAHPFHPQGVGMHGNYPTAIDYPSYKHLGRKIKFEHLPDDCKRAVIQDYKDYWRLQ